jgi:hypothetical protein
MKLKELLIENQLTEKVATRPNAISSMAGQLTQPKKETPVEKAPAAKKPRAISTAGPGAGAFGQMATQLAGNKPNTMANAPVSASNKAKPDNPNIAASPSATKTPSFAGPSSYGNTTTTFKAPAEKPASGTTQTPDAKQPAAQDATTVEPSTSTKEPEAKKPGLLQKIGKGVGDLVTGFKQGYSGNYDLSGDNEQPAATPAKTGSQAATTNAPTTTQNTGEPAATSANAGDQTTTTVNAPATKVTFSSIKPKIDKLDKKGKQRILAALRKNLGVANTGSPSATTTPAVEKPATTATPPVAAGASDLEKNARAAAAKPGFQRSAEEKIAIRTARAQGIDIPESRRFKKSLKESKNYSLPFSLFKK